MIHGRTAVQLPAASKDLRKSRREDIEKNPGRDCEQEHGYLVVLSRPIPNLLQYGA
jgi:hypothetical protein